MCFIASEIAGMFSACVLSHKNCLVASRYQVAAVYVRGSTSFHI